MRPCPTDDASEAMRDAHHAAEQVEALLDRYWGDAGSDADMVNAWKDTLEDLAREIRREIGEPKERLPGMGRHGGLVSPSYLKLHQK